MCQCLNQSKEIMTGNRYERSLFKAGKYAQGETFVKSMLKDSKVLCKKCQRYSRWKGRKVVIIPPSHQGNGDPKRRYGKVISVYPNYIVVDTGKYFTCFNISSMASGIDNIQLV